MLIETDENSPKTTQKPPKTRKNGPNMGFSGKGAWYCHSSHFADPFFPKLGQGFSRFFFTLCATAAFTTTLILVIAWVLMTIPLSRAGMDGFNVTALI